MPWLIQIEEEWSQVDPDAVVSGMAEKTPPKKYNNISKWLFHCTQQMITVPIELLQGRIT
jgi:hypothetical protein